MSTYFIPDAPPLPPAVNNESLVRAIDRTGIDRYLTFLASGRRLNNPGGVGGYQRATATNIGTEQHVYGRCRVPPGCVAIRIHALYGGGALVCEVDGQNVPTWGGQQIAFPNSNDPIGTWTWAATAPYTGTLGTPPDGAFDATVVTGATLPTDTWQDVWLRWTIQTPSILGTYTPLASLRAWWAEPVMGDAVAI